MPDQPLITCNREGTTKFLLYPAVINGDMLTGANAGVPQNQLSWIVQLQLNDEGGKIFDAGSRAPIAVWLFVKNPDAAHHGRIHFHAVDDYLTRERKLAEVMRVKRRSKGTPYRRRRGTPFSDMMLVS